MGFENVLILDLLNQISGANAELFTIRMHCMVDDIEAFVGYVDYVCADQISRLELLSMARELKLEVERCNIWYLDAHSASKSLKEISSDLDALTMANYVDSSREICVCIKNTRMNVVHQGATGGNTYRQNTTNAVEIEDSQEDSEVPEEDDLEGILILGNSKEKNMEEEVHIHDSEYSYGGGSEDDCRDDGHNSHDSAIVEGEAPQVDFDDELFSDHGDSGELYSCSSTDSEELMPCRPKYSEFNEEINMGDPQFKIGMKFRDFKQFKDAVKNYGIKNIFVMNFRPNDSRRCKATCARGCPFYLWASLMERGSTTVQIKSGFMKHECAKEHKNRHVSAPWIARKYREQFRADPAWKLSGIIQAVRLNQSVEISRLTAFRAKSIALRLVFLIIVIYGANHVLIL